MSRCETVLIDIYGNFWETSSGEIYKSISFLDDDLHNNDKREEESELKLELEIEIDIEREKEIEIERNSERCARLSKYLSCLFKTFRI